MGGAGIRGRLDRDVYPNRGQDRACAPLHTAFGLDITIRASCGRVEYRRSCGATAVDGVFHLGHFPLVLGSDALACLTISPLGPSHQPPALLNLITAWP